MNAQLEVIPLSACTDMLQIFAMFVLFTVGLLTLLDRSCNRMICFTLINADLFSLIIYDRCVNSEYLCIEIKRVYCFCGLVTIMHAL